MEGGREREIEREGGRERGRRLVLDLGQKKCLKVVDFKGCRQQNSSKSPSSLMEVTCNLSHDIMCHSVP